MVDGGQRLTHTGRVTLLPCESAVDQALGQSCPAVRPTCCLQKVLLDESYVCSGASLRGSVSLFQRPLKSNERLDKLKSLETRVRGK